MTVEEVYTNAFDARKLNWTETGASPYLNDSDANYISVVTDAAEEGDWTFPASGGSGTINSVKLRFEAKYSGVGPLANVYVWNGTSWVYAGSFTPASTSYLWYEKDVSAILSTWAKINGAEVYLACFNESIRSITVRRLTRKVDYTPAAGGQQLFTLINEEDY